MGSGPEGGLCYGGEISAASFSTIELLALNTEGGPPLQAKRVCEGCRVNIRRALSRYL